jgi:Domain of unknown function (DUF4062)/Tetratricopeptide repeat
MVRVYVSSTVADLKRERRAVMDWLEAADHQVVNSYRPNSETVRESCLDDVGTCDLYVLILGHRYGFQPADDNPEGLSITRLEFRRAGECGIPRVALLRTSIPDVRLSDMEDAGRAPLVLGFRAEVAREVRPAEFDDKASLIQGLSTGVQGELAKLSKRAERSAGQMAGRVLQLAPRPVFLVGREGLLAELADRLGGDGAGEPQVVAFSGLGGAGKTSVALEYAHRHLSELDVVWQFPAEDPAVLAAGWLLMFDNAPDRAAVAAFVPPAGRGRVLITSRSPFWPPGQALQVPVLDTGVAAQFLASRTGEADDQAALALAAELGGLPLALEQAGAYIQASDDSLAGYVALWQRRRAELLARGEPGGDSPTVATTWRLAFEQLQQAAPGAVGLLRLLAACAPEAIPLPLLLQPRPELAGKLDDEVARVLVPLLEDELAARDAIAALRRYSLITPAGGRSVSVHRLVQAVTVDQMPAELAAAWRQATAALIEAALPDDPDAPETWAQFAALLPHAQTALTDESDGIEVIAAYLGANGSYPAAMDLYQRVFDARARVSGPEAPDTLSARASLATYTGRAGDAAGARDQYAALLPVRERVSDAEDPGTLTVRANLAYWTGEAGDVAGARDQFAALLPVRERVSGPEDPETLTVRANLADWTGRAGDEAGARDQFAALLPVRERVSGPEHPSTLIVRDNLAGCTGRAGDEAGARDQYAALLPVMERVYGPDHPDTLRVRANLASFSGRAGDVAGARDQCAALLPVMERVYGPDHPGTLSVRDNLANFTGGAGDVVGARDQYAALLPVRERVSGPEHPNTLRVRANLAYFTGDAGDAAGARDQFAALLPIRERVLGAEHPDTLTTRSNLAHWSQEAERGGN